MTKIKILASNLLIAFLFFPLPAQAQVVINEVFPAPESGSEWIELYNSSDQEVNLNGWFLEDLLSSPSIITTINNQVLAMHDFLTIELATAKLNNAADGVVLKNQQAEIINQMSYNSSQAELSWSRNNIGVFELTAPTKTAVNIFSSPTPTPTSSPNPTPSPNISPSPTPSASPTATNTSFHHLITITEFAACPLPNESEWLELHNQDTQSHSISNWRIRDQSQQTRLLEVSLAPGEYQTISWSGSLLNNSGDEFTLENELGDSLQSINYEACQSNTSFIRLDQNWIETTQPTPGQENSYPDTTEAGAGSNEASGDNNGGGGGADSSQTSSPSLSLASPIPPSPPPPLHSPGQLILVQNSADQANSTTSTAVSATASASTTARNKLLHFTTKKLPRVAILSVILGGAELLLISGWKINEEVSHLKSTT